MTVLDSDLDKLTQRLLALQAKTVENGCTEAEALSAAAKVAELLDRYGLSLGDVELRSQPCAQAVFDTSRKRRAVLEGCIGSIAAFCDCGVWRENNPAGTYRYVFLGLDADVAAAQCLSALIDGAMQTELLRFKATKDYLAYPRRDQADAGKSFLHGMAASIAVQLDRMKAARDAVQRGSGRDLVAVKHDVVAAELARLGLVFKTVEGGGRRVHGGAYEAGNAAGETVPLT
jgi:hypothetical protein